MDFYSTRGAAPVLGFCDAVLAGLAADGGLYLPATWPQIAPEEIAGFAKRPYAEVAYEIISRFVDDEIPAATLAAMVDAAYAGFRHPSVTPLVEIGPGRFVLELFHGPTLAFKDLAMQFLARAMDHVLAARGGRATIVGATSGDTGSAAIEAFRGRDATDIFIFHPQNLTSEVQRRQMTTVLDANVFNIALKGTFDDCQAMVKSLFGSPAVRSGLALSGVNSINWGRIVPQIVYYFVAASALGAPNRPVTFVVPTGNFGDIFAGYAARRMGLPIAKLVIATNANDILTRTLASGRHDTRTVVPTMSPSMDIQISSNFERALFEALGRDAAALGGLMGSLRQSGGFALPAPAWAALRAEFAAGRADEAQTTAAMTQTYAASGYIADPHTAVGLHVAAQLPRTDAPIVTLATAHPAKFPAAVKNATGVEPALPAWLCDLYQRPERYDVLGNDPPTVENYLRGRSRAGRNG